jgi:hypothetical protein
MSIRIALFVLLTAPVALLAHNQPPRELVRTIPSNPVPKDMVRVKFSAEVIASGISTIKIGDKATGFITYDRKTARLGKGGMRTFFFPKGEISLDIDELQFSGPIRYITIDLRGRPSRESVEAFVEKVYLPKGWVLDDNMDRGSTYMNFGFATPLDSHFRDANKLPEKTEMTSFSKGEVQITINPQVKLPDGVTITTPHHVALKLISMGE